MEKIIKKIKKIIKRIKNKINKKYIPSEFTIYKDGIDGKIYKMKNEKKKFIFNNNIKFVGYEFEYTIKELKDIIKSYDKGYFR